MSLSNLLSLYLDLAEVTSIVVSMKTKSKLAFTMLIILKFYFVKSKFSL